MNGRILRIWNYYDVQAESHVGLYSHCYVTCCPLMNAIAASPCPSPRDTELGTPINRSLIPWYPYAVNKSAKLNMFTKKLWTSRKETMLIWHQLNQTEMARVISMGVAGSRTCLGYTGDYSTLLISRLVKGTTLANRSRLPPNSTQPGPQCSMSPGWQSRYYYHHYMKSNHSTDEAKISSKSWIIVVI